MQYWLLAFFFNLIVPVILLTAGIMNLRNPPEKITWSRGYRSRRSMKSQEAWEFAHRYSGRLWSSCGAVLLFMTIVVMVWLYGKPRRTESVIGGIFCILQCLVMAFSMLPTELALKRKFGD